jgi:hypothetical protein
MYLSRKNQRGGRKLTSFPIREEAGKLGYLLGYCDNCNEQLLMALQERDELIATFHCSDETYQKIKKILTPKFSLWHRGLRWVVKWLNGKMIEVPLLVDNN